MRPDPSGLKSMMWGLFGFDTSGLRSSDWAKAVPATTTRAKAIGSIFFIGSFSFFSRLPSGSPQAQGVCHRAAASQLVVMQHFVFFAGSKLVRNKPILSH